ncbi:MAG: aminoglycoside phosphotransferase family protein [Oscillospiraceae bacterium]|jgi:tRNA A-37 threonylcarbamoyl transferase component Bud32|nr:aminoglycoside phosphotransferase family protein [Oscillospiraceae bacterium]
MLFTADIHDWPSWGAIFQSIDAFAPLIGFICDKEGIERAAIEHCTPGTNAVFKLGGKVFKIYAPLESGVDSSVDYATEVFGMERAYGLGVSVPKLIAKGAVKDKYLFQYLVLEYIEGKAFGDVCDAMAADEKYSFGKALRLLCDKMNTPCEAFNNRDVLGEAPPEVQARWGKFTPQFNAERKQHLSKLKAAHLPRVYIHGDLNPDNILLSGNALHLIDFADAALAPVCCEYAVVAGELFGFEAPFLRGFFGEASRQEIIDICFDGLLLCDFGANIIRDHFDNAESMATLKEFRKRLEDRILR